MKLQQSITVLIFSGLLTGCLPGGSSETPADKANAVIAGTKNACNFVPVLANILTLVGTSGAAPAGILAQQICAEIEKLPQFEQGEPTNVTVAIDGVPIEGQLN